MNAPPRLPRSKRLHRGTVLIIVLWIALGLVSLALYFGQTVRWSFQASENALAGQQAEQAIDGARRYITYILENFVTTGESPDLDSGDYLAEAVGVGDARFWLIGRDPDSEIELSTPSWGLIDESAKLNVNTATQEMLEALPNMTSDIAAAIIDWRDADSDLTPGGAESADYESLSTPYSAKNGPFESIDELRLVKGIDLKILWGEDVNGNGILDPNENDGAASWPEDNADGKLNPGLAEYLTVWSREPNTRTDGSQRINITQNASMQPLRQLLEQTFGADRANQVMQRLGPRLDALTSVLEFYMNSGLTADEFSQIEDALTTVNDPYIMGRVNVRTASSTALTCLPGMDQTKAQTIIAERQKRDETSLKSIAWVGGILDATTIHEAGPFLTTKSYQFRADIAALGANGRGLRRTWIIFDHGDQTSVIYRCDRARMGWPLAKTSLEGSQTKTAVQSETEQE